MKWRVWTIAILTLLIQGFFSLLGFLVGLVVVGLVLGYRRAWEINSVSLPKQFEEDGD